MKCLACGGILRYENGTYICENCDSSQQVESYYESTDVYLCYTETDCYGRRSKDSIMAQGIYNYLQNANINTFYQRNFSVELFDYDLEFICNIAFNKATIIVICASSAENFKKLLDKNKDNFSDKIIIPVYSEINANDMPSEIRKLQAINYDNIGSLSDLQKNILILLGRSESVEVSEINNRVLSAKKRSIIIISSVLTFLLIVATYIICFTPYVLKSKKITYAQNLISKGKYIEAASILNKIEDYKNADEIIKKIYDRYDGYFTTDDNTLSVYINVVDGLRAELEIYRFLDNSYIKATADGDIVDNSIDFYYRDTEENQGIGKLEFLNDSVKIKLETDGNQVLSLGNIDSEFILENKTDSPILPRISSDELLSWLQKDMTIADLTRLGYETEPVANDWQIGGQLYKIKNTDIQFILYNYAFPEAASRIICIMAPASLVIPEYIGDSNNIIIKNDYVYVPDGTLYCYGPKRCDDFIPRNIEANTQTAFTARFISDILNPIDIFENLIISEIYYDITQRYTELKNVLCHNLEYEIFAQNDNYYLYGVTDHMHTIVNSCTSVLNINDTIPLYKVRKSDFHVEFCATATLLENKFPYKIHWQSVPKLIKEFCPPDAT